MANLNGTPSTFQLIASVAILLFASCSLLPNEAAAPGRGDGASVVLTQFPEQFLNSHLALELPSNDQQPPNSQVSNLLLSNTSEYTIKLPPDYGLRILALDEASNIWGRVESKVEYLGDGEILEPNEGTDSNWITIIPVSPEGPALVNKSRVVIIVEGQIVSNDNLNGARTAAYIEVPVSELVE